MALEDILSKLTTKEKAQEQFLAVEIGSETVTTAVWQVIDGQTKIIKVGTTEEWEVEKGSNEGLLVAIDNSLQKLEEIKPEPNKVIFGLQEGWVEGEEIVKEHAKTLRQISQKFGFKPIGFVVTTEAIVQLLKREEGTPPTAILVRVNQSEIQVTLVNLGKVVGSEVVARSEDVGADVEEGLARFETTENFPSRMLLYNASLNLEDVRQDLLSYNWLEKLPFLHFPKVEILDIQVTIKAVAIAGGTEAAKALGFEMTEEEDETREEVQEEPRETEAEETEEKEKEGEPEIIAQADEIGFKLESDVYQPTARDREEHEEKPLFPKKTSQKEEQRGEPEARQDVRTGLKHILAFLPRPFPIRMPKLSLPDVLVATRIKVALIVALGFFGLLTGLSVYGYWTIPKARLILYVKPRTLEKELTVTISPESTQIESAKNLIPGKIVEIEVENSKEKEVTGIKVVGEKAAGEVTIYNKTTATKTFPEGTVVLGPNNLAFTLDGPVTVASASAKESDEALTTMFGKAKGKATASQIGSEYNLSTNTDFSLKSFSTASYDAKNETPFSGGTSREVPAISDEDIETLLAELTTELKTEGAVKLEEKEDEGNRVLNEGAETEVISQELSGKVGDEAQKIQATIRLKVKSLAYREDDLKEILRQAISEATPQDFELQEEESQTEIRSADMKDAVGQVTLLYKAVLVPQIDEEQLKQDLKGKYPDIALEFLEKLPNVVKVDIQITPSGIPDRLKHIPRFTKNISIEMKVEERE